MRYFCAALLLLGLSACGQTAKHGAPELGSGLPSPWEIERAARPVTRTASSGPLVDFQRTLQSPGAQYVPWAGGSANAEVAGSAAVIHGDRAQLNYAFYQVSPAFDNTDTLAQISLNYSWSGAPPAAPAGLYLGLPDQAHDRWVWLDAAGAQQTWLDVASYALKGVDPASHPNGSFVVLVNFSDSDVTLSSIALRFTAAGSSDDERIYYTAQAAADAPGVTGIAYAPLEGGPPEQVMPYDAGGFNRKPFVSRIFNVWQIVYERYALSPAHQEVWAAQLDGSGQVPLENLNPAQEYIPQGWEYGANKGFMTLTDPGAINESSLWVIESDLSVGRLSRSSDYVQKAIPDLSVDHAFTAYSAYASMRADPVLDRYWIVRFSGNLPFPIDATPTLLYSPVGNEDARDPEMVELDQLSGNPNYHIYFAARDRGDGPNYNLYRYDFASGEVEPFLLDPAHDLRYPAPSADGRYLAFQRSAPGSGEFANGELVVVDLLHPEAGERVVATDCGGQLSWYDPGS